MFDKNNLSFFLSILSIGVILFIILGFYAYSANDNGSRGFSVSARAATLYEPETGLFLYEKNADEKLPMASTTKIMTALVTLKHCELNDLVEISNQATGIEGSSAYLKAGELLTVEQLLYALLLQSANDAATALAIHVSGNVEDFSLLMNEYAKEIGAINTSFTNPHGLDDDEHYTTSRDLALIAADAIKNDNFLKIVSTKQKTFNTEYNTRTYVNHNKLLRLYDGCIGIKTGFTKKSGRCLVGAALRDGLTLISVTLDAPSDWNDHRLMFDYGYDALQKITFATCRDHIYKVPVIDGKSRSVIVSNTFGADVILPKGDYEVNEHIKLIKFAVAPIKEGEILGEIIYTLNGEEISRINLVATETIEKQKEMNLFNKILHLFNK